MKRVLRYRKNYRKLPGSPDIVILRHHIAVFLDGEFGRGKGWSQKKARLISNPEYWIEKIEENMARDKGNDLLLSEMGWAPIYFWEKEVNETLPSYVDNTMKIIGSIESAQKANLFAGKESLLTTWVYCSFPSRM